MTDRFELQRYVEDELATLNSQQTGIMAPSLRPSLHPPNVS